MGTPTDQHIPKITKTQIQKRTDKCKSSSLPALAWVVPRVRRSSLHTWSLSSPAALSVLLLIRAVRPSRSVFPPGTSSPLLALRWQIYNTLNGTVILFYFRLTILCQMSEKADSLRMRKTKEEMRKWRLPFFTLLFVSSVIATASSSFLSLVSADTFSSCSFWRACSSCSNLDEENEVFTLAKQNLKRTGKQSNLLGKIVIVSWWILTGYQIYTMIIPIRGVSQGWVWSGVWSIAGPFLT